MNLRIRLRPLQGLLSVALLGACGRHPQPPTLDETHEGPLHAQLVAGASPNAVDTRAVPPIVEATRVGRPDLLRALLAAGADVSAKDAEGKSALHVASERGDELAITMLLAGGAAVDQPMAVGNVLPLHLAARAGCTSCLTALAEAGAALDARDGWGATVVHYAAREHRRRDGAALRWVLDKGASPHARDARGQGPAHYAASTGSVPDLALLAERGGSLDEEDARGFAPCDVAQWTRADPALRWLLSRGHLPHKVPPIDPLEDAARRNDADALFLLASIEPITRTEAERLTPLVRGRPTAARALELLRAHSPK